MKEVGISFSCLTASKTTMSTCSQRYPISVGKKDEFNSVPQTTIQVLAAFSPDGYFNNRVISKYKVVFAS
ncbi:hypothetical protein C7475_108111 [Chitinophaga sp. S165]|nr:hypothetical protein C7475_108111 [Chitinophaga sp. S165]